MRIQDEHKKEAIFNAVIKMVNEIGFAAASVAKIAKVANVSPATLYIYHKNKEELLISMYIEIKKKLGEAMLKGFEESAPLKDSLRQIWYNAFSFISKNRDYFQYAEQFANSPYNEFVNHTELEEYFWPIINRLKAGVKDEIIKKVDFKILEVFMFYPVMILSNQRICKNIKMTNKNIESAFEMAWDAISL